MAEITITHTATVLAGTISLPTSAATAAWTNFGSPLEKEVPLGSETTIMLASSNLHDPLQPGYRWAQTTHVVGVRFAGDSILSGEIALDMRNTDYGEISNAVDNAEYSTAFALGDDHFLVIKSAGAYMDDWSYSTVAYVLQVDDAGQPVVVEKKIIQAPAYYCPRRGQLLCIAPTLAWATSEEYLPRLSRVIAQDEFGCFGIAVSSAGFGAKTRYPDPPAPPNDGVLDAWEWPTPGQSINATAILSAYHYSVGMTSQFRSALYYPETGTMADLTNSYSSPFIASTEGEKGDIYTSVDNLYFSWGWNDNSQYTLTGNTLALLFSWDGWGDSSNSFNAFDPALQGEISWSDRTWMGEEERRFGTFVRTLPRDPQLTSLAEIYASDLTIQGGFATLEAFRTAVLSVYPTEQAYIDAYNSQGVMDGYYIGFQTGTPTPETTHWAELIGNDDLVGDISQIVAITELGASNIYYTVSEASYLPGEPRTIIRWDPVVPTVINGQLGPIRRAFARGRPSQ